MKSIKLRARELLGERNKYQWPADRLSEKEMAILYEWRKKTDTPINHLLSQAVILMDKIIKREIE